MVGIVLLSVLAVSAAATAGPARSGLAARLAARDPGARVDGDTIVVTGGGARVYGAPDRPNFIAALGSHETIVGGNREDDLAALGDGVTIIGGAGNELLYGDRGASLNAGSGHDILTERGAHATIRARTGDVVFDGGRDDRVLCPRGARDVTVYAGRSDSVSATCRAGGGRVLYTRLLRAAALPAAEPREITGDGTNDRPFVAPCDPGGVDCTVSVFPSRTLDGGWANEFVPAYKCPSNAPYLYNHNYAPAFTTWGPGVEIVRDDVPGLGYPVQVYINNSSLDNLENGIRTGLGGSTATNWLWGGRHWYRIVLHCTSVRCSAYELNLGRPRGCPR